MPEIAEEFTFVKEDPVLYKGGLECTCYDEEKYYEEQKEKEADLKEKKIQEAMLLIKKKHGKNKILKGTSYEEAATGRARNAQIGGHRE